MALALLEPLTQHIAHGREPAPNLFGLQVLEPHRDARLCRNAGDARAHEPGAQHRNP